MTVDLNLQFGLTFDMFYGFCIMFDIFSRRILFSRSISVNLTSFREKYILVWWQIETVDSHLSFY